MGNDTTATRATHQHQEHQSKQSAARMELSVGTMEPLPPTRARRTSSVESALAPVGDDVAHTSGMMGGCCRGYSARMLFLMGCAMIDYAGQAVLLSLGPMIALHFYPETSYPRLGFYTALLSGSGYLGNALSCRLWINMARSLKSSKGVILWGLSVLGAGFFSLLLCQSLLAMTIVRFAMGVFSGVTPVALIEIENICGNRQTRLAIATKYVGILVGGGATFALVGLGDKLFKMTATEHDETEFYFYPFCFASILSWIAVVITLIGLRMRSRASYVALRGSSSGSNDSNFHFPQQQQQDLWNDTPTASPASSSSSSSSVGSTPGGHTAAKSLKLVKHAFEETFGRNRHAPPRPSLRDPQPHFRMIRSILPHYYHGYSESGHVVIWDFLGQIKMDKLTSCGFTTMDVRAHYQFFLQFALEKLVKTNNHKLVYVIDLEGLTIMDADERILEGAVSVVVELQRTFPDKLSQLAIIHAPVWFSQTLAVIKPSIAKKTLEKIRIFPMGATAQELLELVGVDSLPKKYGGRNGVEFGRSSQERALDEHLRQTTGTLDETMEIITVKGVRAYRAGSLRSEDGSDEEAFFDCSEYGLQNAFDEDEFEDDISIVVHSQMNGASTEAVSRPGASPTKPQRSLSGDKKVHDLEMGSNSGTTIATGVNSNSPIAVKRRATNRAAQDTTTEIAITQEPHACLVLFIYFVWLLVQMSFDEVFPLWLFKKGPAAAGGVHSVEGAGVPTIVGLTMHVSASLASMALTFLCCHLLCCRSSSVMSPLAILRVGLLFQIPIVSAFPLFDVFHLSSLPLAAAGVVVVVLLKHLTGAIAMHGLMTLLDNSIAVDRRLAAHRAAHVVSYVACFFSAGASPALFGLLGYFAKPFPFDQNLLYFVQSLGLIFLFFFSFLIPSRLNFPMLFAMSKR